MTLFDKIKAAFDRGGIGLKLELPKNFSWGDPTIPATVVLTGHKEEPRLIESLRFDFVNVVEQSDRKTASDRDGNVIRIQHEHPGMIELAPGQEVTITVDVPAYLGATDEEAALDEAGVPKLMQGAMKFLELLSTDPEDVRYYEITVWAQVNGVQNPKGTTRRILNQKSHGFKLKTTIGGIEIS